MIPERVVEVLQGASVMQVGTRNAELRPAHSYVCGALVHGDRETVTFFVTERRSVRILSDLEDNGRVALTIAQASHEAYQLKGTYVSTRPASDADYAFEEDYRAKLWPAIAEFWPEEMVKPLFLGAEYRPSVAITVRVEEVFEQTPGPRAGSKLV
ncbi:MAG: pyridoxamine 5'-phosphate oxidase family protein [Candidatus Binatia bacterium]